MAYPQKGQRGTGRRKCAIARVRLVPGKGTVLINGRTPEHYFGNCKTQHVLLVQPLVTAKMQERYNVLVNVVGGGLNGQAEAVRLGVARALAILHPDLHTEMRAEGYLTRDPRVKERKKYGLRGARAAYQYSKR
jgi:small subunit ribosomal protein S9